MDSYIYQSNVYCEECAGEIKLELDAVPASDRDDSEYYPQGPYPDGGGEADSPSHCGACGVFLENPLTSEGCEHLTEIVNQYVMDGRGNAEVIRELLSFYQLRIQLVF